MKRKRYKKGELFGDFLLIQKEVFPTISNGGKRKTRRAFFQCKDHPENFFKLSIDKAHKRSACPCEAKFNGEDVHFSYTEEDVANYSYAKAQNWHKRALKATPADWFRVTRIGIFLKRMDGSPLLFYKFEKTNKGIDYLTAKKIESSIWNRPKKNRSFYLTRLSYEFDALHRDERMNFKSDLWNRGSGAEVFNELLIENSIV